MRPINNVVDASNYVMLELDQPNHAYDLASLGGGGFRVRLARDGERIVTLDGVERTLTDDDLLICDLADQPIGGLGGVMGGLHSEITDATTEIALEIAYFEPTGMTRTMNRVGVRTEASGRFERGVDPYGMPLAQVRFVELLRLTCPDLVVHAGAVDARHDSLPPQHRSTPVRVREVNRILGTSLDAARVTALLDPIGYRTISSTGDGTDAVLEIELPSWRPDSTEEIDVVEEVARHVGYDQLGRVVPSSTMHGRLSPAQQRRRALRGVLLGLGLDEAITDTFLRRADLEAAHLDTDVVRVTNPLVADEDVLRPSLRPGMLRAVAFDASHRRTGVTMFEIGRVYPPGARQGDLPAEYESLGVVLAGRDAPAAVQVWREIAAAMGIGARIDQATVPGGLHPTRSATLSLGRDVVGAVGEIHPDVLDAFDVGERVAWLELDLSRLLSIEPKIAQWKQVSRFPSTDLDVAIVVPSSVTAEKVDKAIRQAVGGLLVDLALFDVYRGPGIADDARSLAYRLRLQAPDRTLTDDDVAAVQRKVVAGAGKLGATLRS
jgi:phenylalanyl-tRNA synthetase beta chain